MDIKENTSSADVTSVANESQTAGMSDKQRITWLVIGDVVVFLVFAFIGRRSHNEAIGIGAFFQVVLTALPFAAAWFIISPVIGAFKRGLERKPGTMATRTLLSWLAAWPVALALRGIFVDHAVPPLTFGIITLVANSILLLLWRWPFAFFMSRRKA